MNERMPRTPFSTPLSRSARETELRLRHIFSGPKKRPPALFLALVFSLCLLCGNLVSCQMAEAENAPPTEVWVDYWIIPWNVPWENSDEEIELPEYPGVTFRWTPSVVSATKDGETVELFGGMPIWNVFLCDLNNDGLREFCATVSYGSGMIDDHIVVYDYAAGAEYTLWDRGIEDYSLSLEDGRLRVTRADYYLSQAISTGGLILTEDGILKMTDEVPVMDAPPAEDGSLNAADADAFYRPYGPASDKLPIEEPLKLWFGSGAGGWATILTLHPDGSFEGDFSDYDTTTVYVCQFHGRFRNIQRYSNAGWTMELEELVLDTGHPIGEEWNEDGYHYISSSPYGFSVRDDEDIDIPLEPGAPFNFYTPEASAKTPGFELYGMEDESSDLFDFWGWWPQRQNITGTDTTLGCYALHNLKSGYGFFDFHSWGLE